MVERTTFVSRTHESKALVPRLVTEFGIVIASRFEQDRKVPGAIAGILPAMERFVTEVRANACVPMFVTLAGIVRLVMKNLLEKAAFPMAVTGNPFVVEGTTTLPPEPV